MDATILGRMNIVSCGRGNIAFSKDTSQSTTAIHLTYPLSASYANDGILNQYLGRGPDFCTNTHLDQSEYWWAVDLGHLYDVDSITIYNRKDCCGERLYDFSIDMYNPAVPSWPTFNAGLRLHCYFHAGRSPDILNLSCDRKTSGRYLQIYKTYRWLEGRDALTLCEVLVFPTSSQSGTLFCKEARKRQLLHLLSHFNITDVQCALLCIQLENCIGFQTDQDQTCNLYQTSKTVDTEDNGSYYYEKC